MITKHQKDILESRSGERAEELGKALLEYETAVIEAYNAADKLISLGVEQPWLQMIVQSGSLSMHGTFMTPGPQVRLQYR
jgi:hypothetical protein